MGRDFRDSNSKKARQMAVCRARKLARMPVIKNTVTTQQIIDTMKREGVLAKGQEKNQEALAEATARVLEMWAMGVTPDEKEPCE